MPRAEKQKQQKLGRYYRVLLAHRQETNNRLKTDKCRTIIYSGIWPHICVTGSEKNRTWG